MAAYKDLVGQKVTVVTSNPPEPKTGQMWYNSTDGKLKGIGIIEATSSSAPISTARAMCAGGGIQTASWLCGGSTGAPTTGTTHTENYNGSGWTTSGNLSNARAHFGATGPQTSGVAVGGGPPFSPSPGGAQANTEEYGGSTWTSGTAVPTNVWSNGMFGTQTAGVTVGSEPNGTNYVFEYDGSSWATGGTMNAIRSYVGSAGTLTAGIVFAGLGPPPNASDTIATELYDGTNWTTAPNLSTANTYSPFSGGSQTAAIKAGGIVTPAPPAVSNVIEKYDGSSWSTSPATLATGRGYSKGQTQNSPSNTAGLFAGGTTGTPAANSVSSTEEFNSSTNIITPGAWGSGSNMNTGRYSLQGFGATHNAAVAFTGRVTPIYNKTEEYNGTSWTEVNAYPQSVNDAAGCGVLTAGLGLGGLYPSDTSTWPTTGRVTAHYDGTNWTSGGSYTYNAWGTGMAGTQTAAIASGGHNYPMPPGNRNDSAEYDGSSWTAGNNMSQVRAIFAAGGSQTASFACGGRSSPGVEDPTNACEEYDGTNWTTSGNYIVSVKENSAGGGPQTAGYVAGGAAPSATAICGFYDGTAWSTAPSLPGAQQLNASTTNNTSNSGAMSFGGGTDNDATYEFTAETTAVNITDFSTS